jgi:hypothetical protein
VTPTASLLDRRNGSTDSDSASPFYYFDRNERWRRSVEDRRARYRGFASADHFLDVAAQILDRQGGDDHVQVVWREYQIIFMGDPIDRLPYPDWPS